MSSSISPNSEPLPSPSAAAPAPAPAPAPAATKSKSKPRKRVNTAEKRHQHNAIERARRETLNSKFLTLARLLPSLANHRRPSKSAIVNGSIGHISRQREQRLLAASLLKQLCRERDELFDEVNEWRKASGVGAKDGPRQAWNDDMEQVCSVEKEVFGNFASMDGDGDDYDGEDDVDADANEGMPHDLSASMSSASGMSFAPLPSVNGLITPRSSTDIDPMSHPGMFAQAQAHAQHHFHQPPHQQHQQHLGVNMHGVNWSQDFANQFQSSSSGTGTGIGPTPHLSSNTPLPFSAFMSDSTDSPGTSNLGNSIMLTPPTTADLVNNGTTVFTHTPSPRPSSASIDDKLPAPAPSTGGATQWTPQQLLFLQQIQQHQAQVRQHQQNLANHYSAFPGNAQQPQGGGGNGNPVDGFTQSLIATMFPQQAHVNSAMPHSTSDMGMGMHLSSASAGNHGGLEQVQQWRKAALSSFLQQHGSSSAPLASPTAGLFPHQLKNHGSGSPHQPPPMLTPGLGMASNPWSPDTAVEGF